MYFESKEKHGVEQLDLKIYALREMWMFRISAENRNSSIGVTQKKKEIVKSQIRLTIHVAEMFQRSRLNASPNELSVTAVEVAAYRL